MNVSSSVTGNARRIVASSTREGLRLVREKLGPDAIVLSNRVIPEGVEIVAIADEAAAPIAVCPVPVADVSAAPAPVQPPRDFSPSPANDPARVIGEIHSMRDLIEEQFAALVWSEKEKRDPVRGRLLRTLLDAGFSTGFSKQLLDDLPAARSLSDGMAWVHAELGRSLSVLESDDALLDAGGVYALVGPTGVGKTTTTAKLAARCVLRFGREKLALLTTDSYRIGAYEQLRIYGEILGVSVHAVRDTADLGAMLDDLRDRHMVLIDTVGMSQRDRAVADQVAMLCGTARPVKRLLLLNAASHGDTLNEVVHAYRRTGRVGDANDIAGCILTKVDEATHPGALLDIVIRHRLPVHYVSTGQKVPEHLMLADRTLLVESAFRAGSRSRWFVPGATMPMHDDAESGAAQPAVERLRAQCRELIRTMVHDAQDLSVSVSALAAGDIGFEGTRALWRRLSDDDGPKAVAQSLLSQCRAAVDATCGEYVLAVSRTVDLDRNESGDAYALHSSLLLSDRTGVPLGAPQQLLATAIHPVKTDDGKRPMPESRQIRWLRQQDFGKPVIHLLQGMPTIDLIREWQRDGISWLARGRASAGVFEGGAANRTTLAQLADRLTFSESEAVTYRGKAALQSVAEVAVRLSREEEPSSVGAAEPVPVLLCVVTQIVEQGSGKLLALWYVIGNIGMAASAQQIAEWHRWRMELEPYFRLLKQGIRQLGGCGEPGDVGMLKRLLVAGQACTTVWRLQHVQRTWASSARAMLAQLTGRNVRPGRPVPGAVLFEGLGKLYALLDVLDADGMPMRRPVADTVTAQD